MKKNMYYVGVFLSERVLFGLYGFTSYVDCYAEADDFKQAGEIAKKHFEEKYKVRVTGTRPQAAKAEDVTKYALPEQIIKLASA